MNTLWLGWEVSNINNAGANLVVPVNNSITITGYQLTLAYAFPGNPSGFAEVLVQGAVINGAPQFSAAPAQYLQIPGGNTDFGATAAVNPNNMAAGGSAIGWNGALFSAILKTNAPQSVNDVITVSGLSISASAGSNIVIHADAAGATGDFEIQGCIYYTGQ